MTYGKPVQLQRDPFGRMTLYRVTIPESWRSSCKWCGNRPGRFGYYWEADSMHPRKGMPQHGFCEVSCARAYEVI